MKWAASKRRAKMKKFLAMALTLALLLPSAAFAQETVETALPAQMTIRVLTAEQGPYEGIHVTVTDEAGLAVAEFDTDATGENIIDLPQGTYRIKAIDPSDGYSDSQKITIVDTALVELTVRKLQKGTELVIGSFTRTSGQFFTDMWGNNTSDVDVRALVHGLNTVAWTNDFQYQIDESVIPEAVAEVDADGNKTYTLTVREGLTYNDGTPITARDYVFSILLQSSAQMKAIGASAMAYAHLSGHAAYQSGEAEAFSGVRLLSDMQFSVTVGREYLPYFYELTYLNITPYPIHVLAPGCEVTDAGNGASIVPVNDADGKPIGAFTAEVLEKTVVDPQTGYLSHPTVSAGPYAITEYDAETGTAKFVVNTYYPGNYEGRKPVIESLVLREVKKDTVLDQIASGEIDVVNKVSNGAVITDGLARVEQNQMKVGNYMRNGYGFAAFACEESATQYVAVRQAVAMCMDKDAFIEAFMGGYGLSVHSYYGLGQWMAQEIVDRLEQEVTLYPYDVQAAENLLVEDGWTLNENGEPFVKGTDGARYKETENGLIPLAIHYAQPEDNDGAALLGEMLGKELQSIGFEFTVAEMPFDELLAHYYRSTDRTYNLMYMATNFTFVFDPYYTFHTSEEYQGIMNTSGIRDEELETLAAEMRRTDPTNSEEFLQHWIKMIKRYSDVLPTLPIYSNVYFDFYRTELEGYAPNAHWSWPPSILYAYLQQE